MVEGEDVCRGGTVTIDVVLTKHKKTLKKHNTSTHLHTYTHFISFQSRVTHTQHWRGWFVGFKGYRLAWTNFRAPSD